MIARWIAARVLGWALALTALAGMAQAQQSGAFIQVEVRNSIEGARASIERYADLVTNVNGFTLDGGWYGVVIGPYDTTARAEEALLDLRIQGIAPPSAYVRSGGTYGARFWPINQSATQSAQTAPQAAPQGDLAADTLAALGGGARNSDTVTSQTLAPAPQSEQTTAQATPQATPQAAQQPAPQVAAPQAPAAQVSQVRPEPVRPEIIETPAEARASERALTREEREELQVALKWAGYYRAAIDGAFGSGTRRSMGAWQADNGYEATGVLTTAQRRFLLQQYNAVFAGLELKRYDAPELGISVELPQALVAYDRTEPPFAIFGATTDMPVRVLLISQPGGQDALSALYEVMQSLEVIPVEGERRRMRTHFEITGRNDRIVSYTEAHLADGGIKGFTLVWPAGDEARRTRVVARMQDSFRRIGGVLDPAEGARIEEGALVAGLRVRQPIRTGAGFFVTASGTLVTAQPLVAGCGRVTVEDDYDARPRSLDTGLGVAVMDVAGGLAPRAVAEFRPDSPMLDSEVAVAGYPYGGVLGSASLTFGALADVTGLNGEAGLRRLELAAKPGDAGGPVLDQGGAVIGMLLPRRDGAAQQLPEEVQFAAGAEPMMALLRQAGQAPRSRPGAGTMAPEDLAALAGDMTVLVQCWE